MENCYHGGIFWTIVYFCSSPNNLASTVMSDFADAVSKKMVCLIRLDLTLVERTLRCGGRYVLCICLLFYDLFQSMEDDGTLNCLHVDMFCLHYGLLRWINQAFEGCVESWNHHPKSTCNNNLTPNRLFIEGAFGQKAWHPLYPCPVCLLQGFQHQVILSTFPDHRLTLVMTYNKNCNKWIH